MSDQSSNIKKPVVTKEMDQIIWVRDLRGGAISFSEGKPVRASAMNDEDGPTNAIRVKPPMPGTTETNVVLVDIDGERFVAHPTKDTEVIELPGYHTPIDLTWEDNPRGDDVVSTIRIEGYPFPIPVFPGNEDRHDTISPNPDRSMPWYQIPEPDDKTYVFIGYHITKDDKIIGYAYPATLVPQDRQLYRFSDGSILIPAQNTEVKAWEHNRTIVILISK